MRRSYPATGQLDLDIGGSVDDILGWLTGKTELEIEQAKAQKAQADAAAWQAANKAQDPGIPVWVWVAGAGALVWFLASR